MVGACASDKASQRGDALPLSGPRATGQPGCFPGWPLGRERLSPVVPASPPPPPVSPLLVRREGCAQRTAAVDSRRRAVAQDEQELAHAVSALRNDILEAARLTRQVRQLQQQATSPAFLMQADARATYERVRHALTTLVGEAEVKRVLADPHYQPWWMES